MKTKKRKKQTNADPTFTSKLANSLHGQSYLVQYGGDAIIDVDVNVTLILRRSV